MSPRLIQPVRDNQVKFRYIHNKFRIIGQALHQVISAHAAHVCSQVTTRHVRMTFTRLYDWLETTTPSPSTSLCEPFESNINHWRLLSCIA